ncbi:MAG: hypothetical protein ACI35O_04400 [Bacillaceae bacterium]
MYLFLFLVIAFVLVVFIAFNRHNQKLMIILSAVLVLYLISGIIIAQIIYENLTPQQIQRR